MPNHQKPSWLPDWRDPNGYTDHGDDVERWAWEFLRRNTEYQADYARWAALPDNDIAEDGVTFNSLKWGGSLRGLVSMAFCAPADGHPAIDGETVAEYEERTGQWPETLVSHLEQKWLLVRIEDPAGQICPGFMPHTAEQELPPYSLFAPEAIYDFGPRNDGFGMEWADGRCMIATWPREIDVFVHPFAIDIRYDITAQLQAIGRSLSDLKRETRVEAEAGRVPYDFDKQGGSGVQRRPDRLLQLLRLFDARWSFDDPDSQEARHEIAKELYEGGARKTKEKDRAEAADEMARFSAAGVDWVRKTMPKALEMVESGWLRLWKSSYLTQQAQS